MNVGMPASSGAVEAVAPVVGRIGDDPAVLPWRPLLAEYLADLALKNDTAGHIEEQRLTVERAAKHGEWRTIADFRSETARAYMLWLHQAGRQPKTQRLYRDALERFGAWLVKRRTFTRNPMDTIPKAKVIPRQARLVPTDEEVSRLIAAVYGRKQAKDRWLTYLTAASTGLRYGTLKQLTWAMVDLDAARVTIPAAILKNRRPMVVHLTDELTTALRWHRAKGEGPLVFRCLPKPEQVTNDAVRAKIRHRDGEATFSFHSLRHYFSNRLMRAGASLEERKLAVGHLNGGVTLQTYTSPELVKVGERVKALQPLLSGERFCHSPEKSACTPADGRYSVSCSGGSHSDGNMVATLQQHESTMARPRPTSGLNTCEATIEGGPSVPVQGVAQLGRAAGLGPAGRTFKSCHPDSASVSSPVFEAPAESGRQVQIQPPTSERIPAQITHLAALLDAQAAQLTAAAALIRGGGL